MRKIFAICIAVIVLAACNKGDNPKPNDNFFIKPNAQVYIKPAQGVLLKAGGEHLTVLEIVKQCAGISFRNIKAFGDQPADCGFADSQRDTLSTPPMLKRWATDLINVDGFGQYYIVKDFIYADNVVFIRLVNGKRDTIAYTPNSVMRQMEADITAALAAKDTTLAYKVFNEWTFTSITGAEWRALKAQGKQ